MGAPAAEAAGRPKAARRAAGRRLDLLLGIVLGIVLGLAVVAAFVFGGASEIIDSPSVSGEAAHPAREAAPATPSRPAR
jgi:hypothetical protein